MCSTLSLRSLVVLVLFSISSGVAQAQDITFTTKSPAALKYFMDGLDKSEFFMFVDADQLFRKAIKADPAFAMAYYYLATQATTTDDYVYFLDKAAAL